jgi:hypothetical protein
MPFVLKNLRRIRIKKGMMVGGKYKVTYKDGRIRIANAAYGDSLILLLGGVLTMLKEVDMIEIQDKGEWKKTEILNSQRLLKPTKFAKWED